LESANAHGLELERRSSNFKLCDLKSRFRIVLFDIDGTLISTGGAGVRAFAKAFETEFGEPKGTEKMKFAGRTDVSLVRELFAQRGIEPSPKNFERFFEAYTGWLQKLIVDCVGGAYPGVLDFCAALEAMPEPPHIGLLTGNIKRGAQIKLGRFELWERFSFGAFADDHEDRDQIAAVARQRGRERSGAAVRDEEILVIGDTPFDIRCGRAIGAKILAVGTGGATMEQLREHKPDWLVENLSKISPADL